MAARGIENNKTLKIGELPELHIVGLDDVVLHEDPDMERVARLVDRFSADGILKNPPVVGRRKGHRRIVLDGANRITALRKLGVTEQPWFRGGDVIPSLSRGRGPAGLPRFERQYFHFAPPVDTTAFAGRADDRDACFELRKQVQRAIEHGVSELMALRDRDPERYPVQRLLRGLAARLG